MLRSFLIYLSKAEWAQNMVTNWGFAWRAASRFVAGNTIEDALRVIKTMNEKGINVTLDHLGEHTATPDEARQATADILQALEAVGKEGLRANVSIKLTQIGLELDEALCAENLEAILRKAQEMNNWVRIDMEDTPYTDQTIALWRAMQAKGFDNVGLVVQAYLYRTEDDVRTLLKEGARFRLVKGAYKEPPDLAWPKKADVDANFDKITRILLDGALAAGAPPLSADGRVPPIPAIGTHDENRINYAEEYAERIGLPRDAMEFQMLYGIRRDLQNRLAADGYAVRVYVPYGTQWYPYFVRRLAERPANLWFFLSNLFRK